MSKKPHDLLDFLRQSGDEAPTEPPAPIRERVDRTTPMLILRKSQVIVASAAAGLALVLVFLLGLALGSGPQETVVASSGTSVWVIRVVSYADTESGRGKARDVVRQLQARDLDQVTLRRIPSQGVIVVTLGAWLSEPDGDERALELRAKVKNLPARGKKRAFPDADFWRIQR